MGEMPVRTTPRLLALLRRRLPVVRARRLEVEFRGGAEHRPMVAPEQTLAEVLHNLVRNAFDAHDEAGVAEPVVVCVEPRDGILVRVVDRGPGSTNHRAIVSPSDDSS
jgi:signal transduction histidine kinase